ncbi:hypothetical protein [Roseomonas sp. AR75]|nr:hypothetical protein [Roseomonas sp. AR75]
MRIPLLNGAELRGLREIRVALEGLATERAAAHATPAGMPALVQLIEGL